MPIFLKEENSELKGNSYAIPRKLETHLKDTLIKVGGSVKNNPIRKEKGFKRLNSLVDGSYNQRQDKNTQNKEKSVTYGELKRIKNVFDHTANNDKNPIYTLNGGTPMKNWVNNTLRRERNKVEPVNKQKKVETRNKNSVKPIKSPTKPIDSHDSKIYVQENKQIIKEDWENCETEHPYYDYILDYDERTVFQMFLNKEPLWGILINPLEYQKALSEFVQFGEIVRFPIKKIYSWMGIIMRNTAILRTTTKIAGHDQWGISNDVFIDVFFEGDYDLYEEYAIEHDLDPNDEYAVHCCYLDEVGFFDNSNNGYCVLPDGSDAWSDFGLEPIEKLIAQYKENSTLEETLTLINKILDVYHCRGDLASAFIRGGSPTLSKITNGCFTENKKVYISEKQLKNLRKRYLLTK